MEGPGGGLANILANRKGSLRCPETRGPKRSASALIKSLSQGLGDCSEQHSSTILLELAAFVVCASVCAALGVLESRGAFRHA